MNTLIISYDLRITGQNYETLYKRIKELGNWWHCLDSTWIVKSNYSAEKARNILLEAIDNNDLLVVIQTGSVDAAWFGLNKECSDWLKANL